MKKLNIAWLICMGGVFTAVTVLFQSAPVFLPMIGLALSPFSTLPVAIASVLKISLGFAVLFASTLILGIVSMQEATILLFATGSLGIAIGVFLYRKGMLISILMSSVALFLGMMGLTCTIHIEAFTDFTASLSIPLSFFIIYVFALSYAMIWNICFKKFIDYLIKIRLIQNHSHK